MFIICGKSIKNKQIVNLILKNHYTKFKNLGKIVSKYYELLRYHSE
jgi:hypothetical protein